MVFRVDLEDPPPIVIRNKKILIFIEFKFYTYLFNLKFNLILI